MRILVTGGAGFIGSNVVDKLIGEGHYVVIVDNLFTGKRENINPKAKFYEVDIRGEELDTIFMQERFDLINHHAAQISVPASVNNPKFDADVNILGLLNLLQLAVKYNVKKIIFISSGGAIYGEQDVLPIKEDAKILPLSPYAITKFVSEHYLRFYNHHYGLNYTVLRYANVYGPRQIPYGEAGVVSIFIDNCLKNKTSKIYRYEEQSEGMTRDYVYVKDVAHANILALDKGNREAINIGTQNQTTTSELLKIIQKIVGTNIPPEYEPPRPGDIRKNMLNIAKAKKVLGWYPKITLEQGIKETVEFMRAKS